MNTRNEPNQSRLTGQDQQQALLFQFLALYERWSEDRQLVAKHAQDLAKQVQQLSLDVTRFSSIEEAVIMKLRKSLDEVAVTLSGQVNSATAEALNNTLGSSMERMDRAAQSVAVILSANKEIAWWRYLKALVLNAVCSLLVSGLAVWFFMPKPKLPLTAEDMTTYLAGKKILTLWSTLPKEKQQQMVALIKDQEQQKSTSAGMKKNKKAQQKNTK